MMSIFSNIRLLITVTAGVALTSGWLYIGILKSQLESKDVELANTRVALQSAIDTANSNAEALNKVDAEHRKTLALLNEVSTSLQETSDRNREPERAIASGEGGADGDVAPVLENLRMRKFSGDVR